MPDRSDEFSFVCCPIGLVCATRIRHARGARPYAAFGGHVHNYRRTVIGGREHIRLGPTGGAWVVGGNEGSFDHLAWVTMTDEDLTIANIVLEGVLGAGAAGDHACRDVGPSRPITS